MIMMLKFIQSQIAPMRIFQRNISRLRHDIKPLIHRLEILNSKYETYQITRLHIQKDQEIQMNDIVANLEHEQEKIDMISIANGRVTDVFYQEGDSISVFFFE
jgi:hypothetical protein